MQAISTVVLLRVGAHLLDDGGGIGGRRVDRGDDGERRAIRREELRFGLWDGERRDNRTDFRRTRRRLRVAGAVVLGALGVAEQPAGHGVDLLVVLSGQTVGIAEDDDGGDGVLRLTGKRLLEHLARAHRLLIANARRGRVVIKGGELRRGEGENHGQRDPHADHDPAGDFADAEVGEEDEGVTHRKQLLIRY